MTQKQKIVNYLMNNKSLTTYSACVKRITTKLPTRIGEIELEGIKIVRKKSVELNIKPHFIYSLGKNNKKDLLKYLICK